MPLENPNYLHDLNEANPSHLDEKAEGDDHIRGVKRALKNTFPGMAGRAWRKRNVSQSSAVGPTDNMTLLAAAAGITLTPQPASTLGNGFMFMVRAPSTGTVIINPAQNINGADQYTVPVNTTALVWSDGAEFFLALMYNDPPPAIVVFPAGTKMLFNQTSAPAGWTKQVGGGYDNAGLRVTTGTVGTGGSDTFTTVFGSGKTTSSHTLTVSQIPSHSHSVSIHTISDSGGGDPPRMTPGGDYGTSATGGGLGHSHNLTMNLKYVDIIVAEKD